MPGSDPRTGDVYYYPYVWHRQGRWARPEKDRPCCVAFRLSKGAFRGADTFLLALTQSGLPAGGYGEEVPAHLLRGLRKLDPHAPTFLVTSEYNSDTARHPSFEDCEYLGTLPLEFLKPILERMVAHIRAGAGEVNRTGAD